MSKTEPDLTRQTTPRDQPTAPVLTERQRVALLREGAAKALWAQWCGATAIGTMHGYEEWRDRRLDEIVPWPAPVMRPRVVTDDSGVRWRISDGRLQCKNIFPQGDGSRGRTQEWCETVEYGTMLVDIDRLALWADLLSRPTEPTPDGESEQ